MSKYFREIDLAKARSCTVWVESLAGARSLLELLTQNVYTQSLALDYSLLIIVGSSTDSILRQGTPIAHVGALESLSQVKIREQVEDSTTHAILSEDPISDLREE